MKEQEQLINVVVSLQLRSEQQYMEYTIQNTGGRVGPGRGTRNMEYGKLYGWLRSEHRYWDEYGYGIPGSYHTSPTKNMPSSVKKM